MANKRIKRGRKKTFNQKGGMHSKSYRIKKERKAEKLRKWKESLRCKSNEAFKVKKKRNLRFTFSQLSLKKAKRYKCLRDQKNNIHLKVSNSVLDGNRIVNIDNLKTSLMEITSHAVLCPEARDIVINGESPLVLESEKRNSLSVILDARCKGCGKVFQIKNSNDIETTSGKRQEINVKAVWGSMVTGGGCSSLNELLGTMGVPGMDEKKYSNLENEIGEWWRKELEEEMKEAGIEEKEHAIESNDYFNGVPAITVVCDGGWCKRSHKHTYNAMAGVAVIFGAYTKKILHIGIRNKLCYICSRAQTQNVNPPDHQCFKNWNESAQSMEADIIVEGFLNCEYTHGIRYMRMIADGDSSVYAKIMQEVPIWGQHVKKLECANHACKCLRGHLENLVEEKPNFKGKGKLTKRNRLRIAMGVRAAIKMRSKEKDREKGITELKKDIRNCGRHVLGLHEKCSTDFCKHTVGNKETDTADKEEIDDLELEDVIDDQCSMWEDVTKDISEDELSNLRKGGTSDKNVVDEELLSVVYYLLNRMAEKADRLIGNFTSNLAESWMHIRCKFDGGKTNNKCFRGSFYARCYGSALRSAKGPAWSPIIFTKISGKVQDSVYLNTYRTRAKKYIRTKISQQKEENKKRKMKRKLSTERISMTKKARQDYGSEVLDDSEDMTEKELNLKCDKYYNQCVKVDENAAVNIEQNTKDQSDSELWRSERKKRLTSSNYGEVMSRTINNNSNCLVKKLLYSNFRGNTYTRKGLSEEKYSRTEYINIKNQTENKVDKIVIPGLVIDHKYPYLAASSDGIVHMKDGSEGLIEIKNLLQRKKVLIREAATKDRSFCLHFKKSILSLKETHKFHYQIQGQLNILNKDWCDLIVRRTDPYDIVIIRLERDINLWVNKMLPKLKAFYFTHILPELSAPRLGTVTGIRKPKIPWVGLTTSIYIKLN